MVNQTGRRRGASLRAPRVSGDEDLDLFRSRLLGALSSQQPIDIPELARPVFRSLTSANGRKGVRLEVAFWKALADISAIHGISQHELITNVLVLAHGLNINATSALRCVAVHLLEQELERRRRAPEATELIALMQVSPVPSFAVDAQLRMVRMNGEFGHYLDAVQTDTPPSMRSKTAQFVFDRPVTHLLAAQESEVGREVGVLIRAGPHEQSAVVRLVVPRGLPLPIFVAYLLP